MTRERVTGAQDAKLQSDEEKHRLRGVTHLRNVEKSLTSCRVSNFANVA